METRSGGRVQAPGGQVCDQVNVPDVPSACLRRGEERREPGGCAGGEGHQQTEQTRQGSWVCGHLPDGLDSITHLSQ